MVWPRCEGLVVDHDGERRHLKRLTWGIPARATVGAGDRPRVAPYIDNIMSAVGFGDRRSPPERCLIILDSFAWPDGERGKRTQGWFGLWDEPLFAWAGIVRDVPGYGPAYAGLLTAANPLVARVADRMPAILSRDQQEIWLTAPLAEAARCRRPIDEAAMFFEPTDEPWPGRRA